MMNHLKQTFIRIILITNFLILYTNQGKSQVDTIYRIKYDFFMIISVKDTIKCNIDYFKKHHNIGARLMRISVDSIICIFTKDIYNSDVELKNTKFIVVPNTIKLKDTNNYVLTGDQYQTEYFILFRRLEHDNISVIPPINNGYRKGLVSKITYPFFWRIWYNLNNTPHEERKHWKKVDKSKDPILKCIRKYEKSKNKH